MVNCFTWWRVCDHRMNRLRVRARVRARIGEGCVTRVTLNPLVFGRICRRGLRHT